MVDISFAQLLSLATSCLCQLFTDLCALTATCKETDTALG